MSDQPAHRGLRHWLGFVASGGTSFVVDAGVFKLATWATSAPYWVARIGSIACAMVVGWLCHRTWTFAVTTPPNIREFGRFAGVAWSASVLNYAIGYFILFVRPSTEPLFAIFIAGICAMAASYFGFRFGAFRRSG